MPLTPEGTTDENWEVPVTLVISGYGKPEQRQKTIELMIRDLGVLGYEVKDWSMA